MTFLSPIPAIIAASLTVPVLIAYYLLKLRRRPVRVSSTLLWMQAVRDLQVNVPFRWLRPTWLFFLQLAILAMLLLAMARPAVDAAGGMPTQVILLFDRTASMSTIDGPDDSARLERAKQEALRAADELLRARGGGSSTSVAVIAFAAEPVAISGFTADRARIRNAIQSISQSDQPAEGTGQRGDAGRGLQAALDLAGAMLAGDVEELGPREHGMVILFSDGVSAVRDGYTLAGEFRYVHIGPRVPPGEEVPASVDNLGIVALSARRDWEEPASVRIFTRIINAGDEAIATPLALLIDGTEVQRTALEVPASADGEPGETAATFRVDLRDGGIATVRLLRDDAMAVDNESSIVIDPARRARILVVAPDAPPPAEGATPRRGPEWLITELVREMRLPLRVVPASVYEQQVAAAGGGSPAAELVIFDRVQPARLPPVPTITFGAGIPLDAVRAEPSPPDDAGTYFLAWQRTHPILRHVALDSIYAARSLRLNVATGQARYDEIEQAAAGAPRVQATELARGEYGPLIIEVNDAGVPRLVVGFELLQSNWPVNPGFMIFMASAVDHLTLRGETAGGRAFSTAQAASVLVPPNVSRLVLEGPRRITADVPPGSRAEGARRINLGLIDRAGVYRIAGAPGLDGVIPAIAVNLADATESALQSRETIRVGGETHAARAGTAGPREVWHWFVLAALGLLCAEWMLNARRMRT